MTSRQRPGPASGRSRPSRTAGAPVLRAIKSLRQAEALNRPLTDCVRFVFQMRSSGVPDAIVRHLPRVGSVRFTGPTGHTLTLRTRGDDGIPSDIFWRGLFRSQPDACIFAILAQKARVTFDVGAYIGLYGLLAAAASPTGHVYAFEPMPRVFERLMLNAEINGMANFTCLSVAAGRDEGTACLFSARVPSLPSSSGLTRAFFPQKGDGMLRIPVPVVRLDTFMGREGIETVDLVKIDTEGTEPDVLAGLGSVLGTSLPHVICELVSNTNPGGELQSILGRHGYRYFHLRSCGPVEVARLVPSRDGRNFLCLARDAEAVLEEIATALYNGPAFV